VPALTILWLAWALSGITKADYLGTGEYLGHLLVGSVDARWMPTIVFLLASMVAFSTGTSWGTMGILMPLVVPTTIQLLGANQMQVSPHDPLLIGSIAGVLAGAIFGDHCSPISDTTVLSSQASGCDHVAHVRTQMPYALLVAGISVVCGTIPIGFGASVWFVLPIGVAAMVAWLSVVGSRCELE
jgi:Na+/H+ antiporter NhaC